MFVSRKYKKGNEGKALRLFVLRKVRVICSCAAVCFSGMGHTSPTSIVPEALSNGMMLCLGQDASLNDTVSLKLVVSFPERINNSRERVISALLERFLLMTFEDLKEQHCASEHIHNIKVIWREPEIFAVPNLTLYKLDVYPPSPTAVNDIFRYLSDSLAMLPKLSDEEIQDRVFDIVEDYKKTPYHPLKPRQPFSEDDPEYPGENLDAFDDLTPSISSEEIRKFFVERYRPENMLLFVYGDFSRMAIMASIRDHLSRYLLAGEGDYDEIYPVDNQVFKKISFLPQGVSLGSGSGILTSEEEEQPQEEKKIPQISKKDFSLPKIVIDDKFMSLELSETEGDTIGKIVTTLAADNIALLLWKKKDLESLGRTIDHVHPLRFIHHIIATPELHSNLRDIKHNFFKWNGFLDGFRRRMTEEYYKDNIVEYLPGFCEELDISFELVLHFVKKKDWEGLVKAML